MIHYVYLGHFAREGDFIRFEKRGDTKPAWYRPVVVGPLDQAVVAELLAHKGLTVATVPDDWGIAFTAEGFLTCDRFTPSREARDFVKCLALRTGCDVADYSTLSFVSPEELWPTEPIRQAGKASKHVAH